MLPYRIGNLGNVAYVLTLSLVISGCSIEHDHSTPPRTQVRPTSPTSVNLPTTKKSSEVLSDETNQQSSSPVGASPSSSSTGPQTKPKNLSNCDEIPEIECQIADRVLAYTNAFRAENNKPALKPLPKVAWLAHFWSVEQGKRGVASHDGWKSGLYAQIYPQQFHEALPRLMAENAGYSQRPVDVETVAFAMFRMWRDSPDHRENMLSDNSYIGVGIARGAETAYSGVFNWFGTQIFLNQP